MISSESELSFAMAERKRGGIGFIGGRRSGWERRGGWQWGGSRLGVGVDTLAHDAPALEVAGLGLLELGSDLVDAVEDSGGGELVGAELAPAIDAALHEVRVLAKASEP